MVKTKLKSGDNVKVISGKHKGTEAPIVGFSKDKLRVHLEGIKMIKHQKPTQQNTEGGIVEINKSIHISNVQLIDPKNKDKVTRIAYTIDNGKKKRIASKSKAFLK